MPGRRKWVDMERVEYRDLGLIDYGECWQLQRELFDEVLSRRSAEGPAVGAGYVLVCEHPHVYTLGKSGHSENMLVSEEQLKRLGAQFYHIDRGGDITYHGPGQLVCYPILDLDRIGLGLKDYIHRIEEAVIECAGEYGVVGRRIESAAGVWIVDGKSAPRKLCALGVRSSHFVTMHGFALNVSTDLSYFTHINPCGFSDRGATSLERETGHAVSMGDVKKRIVKCLERNLNVRIYKN